MTIADQLRGKIVAIYRAPQDADRLIEHAEMLREHGVDTFEITVESPTGRQALVKLTEWACPECLIGAGTVTTPEQLDFVKHQGAQFAVSPGLSPRLIDHARSIQLPYIPGVLTPTEVMTAQALDVQLVKLFPAGSMGSGYLKTLRAPFPNMEFMVTGGLEPSEAAIYFAAGAHSIGMGRLSDAEQQSELFVKSNEGKAQTLVVGSPS